jgi:hypothetical protein
MTVFKLAPIAVRTGDEKWAASNLKEAVWVEARDELTARHLVEGATLQMQDVQPGRKLNIFSPWLDDVVTSADERCGWAFSTSQSCIR